MSNQDKVLSVVKLGVTMVDDIAKRTGLTCEQVLSAARNIRVQQEIDISIKTQTIKSKHVILNEGIE